jgi:hypothetical protein
LHVRLEQKSPMAMTGKSGSTETCYRDWHLTIFLSLFKRMLEEGTQWVFKLHFRMAVQHAMYSFTWQTTVHSLSVIYTANSPVKESELLTWKPNNKHNPK